MGRVVIVGELVVERVVILGESVVERGYIGTCVNAVVNSVSQLYL